jgi:pimeloyl-ACP methyl ester carboxylesterase
MIDHSFAVPLDHDEPDGERIEIYARELRRGDEARPWLLFLNGGPGFPSPRPLGTEGWLQRALSEFSVLLLDQRGTGRSTPVTRRTLAERGDAPAQAEYLAQFRADSIVRDAESIRRALIGDEPWSVLGQSFGGLCAVSYLSFAPEGLREVFITGGLPGLTATADEVYRALYPRVVAKNFEHYERHPEDVERAARVARHLRDHDVRLPGGRSLTVEAFQSLGNVLLGSSTGSRQLNYLLEAPFDGKELSDAFLFEVESRLSWAAAAPLYSLLHEATYAQGEGATAWSAQRIRAEFGEFDAGEPVLFTGEMIYPWMFDTDPMLRGLKETAHLLAEREDWPALYDPERLRTNTVPAAAAVYYDDLYLDFDLSMRTARSINGLRPWVTNEYGHDGLRMSNGAVLERLIADSRTSRRPW